MKILTDKHNIPHCYKDYRLSLLFRVVPKVIQNELNSELFVSLAIPLFVFASAGFSLICENLNCVQLLAGLTKCFVFLKSCEHSFML